MNSLGQIIPLASIKRIVGNEVNCCRLIESYAKSPRYEQRKRSGSKKVLENPWLQLAEQSWSVSEFRDHLYKLCISDSGKYVKDSEGFVGANKTKTLTFSSVIDDHIKRLEDLEKKLLDLKKKFGITNKKDICMPDNFSNEVVKPTMRQNLKHQVSSPQHESALLEVARLSIVHTVEREIVQVKSNLSELAMLNAFKNSETHILLPTLKHRKGSDFYLFDSCKNEISGLDIKTSRWPKFLEKECLDRESVERDPESLLIKLYENQGEERFSDKARLILVLPPAGEKLSLNNYYEQFLNTYNIEFTYKKTSKKYNVEGCKIIFL